MPEPDRPHPLDYAAPGAATPDPRGGPQVARRIALGVGLGLVCFGVGWGLTPRPPRHVETAWIMGVGGLIVGIAAPSSRR